ncbi:alpha/beta hydrolase [Nocardia sp. CDC159]|uniref:Alpha/beta hydrolase n=1 Tax=Nocardia pulmonis TaxID=2951408 RepID=A0A9X2EDM9_9NOCA|nr:MULTISPECIES: alpha/beta hydrolase [Nocardia]MCM6778992.1 alpha/beta hydrolase [Nocardia pulmonis]MCM6791869.1 alpha/beta hydrolase [Nocardia sp. CDC159]
MPWRRIGAALAVVAILSGVSCANEFPKAGPRWAPCAPPGPSTREWECATLTAPLDHRDPGGARVELAVIRTRSADPAQRLGSLVYNPGGPGGSGVENVAAAAEHYAGVLDRYDLVSWDPRGVGRSTPVTCSEVAVPDRLPRTDAEWARLDEAARRFAESCAAQSKGLLSHVGLFDSARDLETIRTALGESKLNFIGVSYGGQLGAAYATLFPDRVGRIVLDAPGSPLRDYRRSLLEQAQGMDMALGQFLDHCLAGANCPLGADRADAFARFDAFLAGLDARPLPTARPEPLSRAAATTAFTIGLAAPETWPGLIEAVAQAYAGDGTELIGYGDIFSGRRADGTLSNFTAANTAVNCADYPDARTAEQVRALLPEFARAAPRFGEFTALRLIECAHWPVRAVGRAPIAAPTAPPILLIANLGDPQARYDWVVELGRALGSGVVLSYDGVGHGAFGGVNECVDRVVGDYLRAGTVPPAETRCR